LIKELGGNINGHWEFGICIANPQGVVGETKIVSDRVFTSEASITVLAGYPLDSLQIDPSSGKYVSDMGSAEQSDFWQRDIGKKLCDFVTSLNLDK